jgi:hypothetical protein
MLKTGAKIRFYFYNGRFIFWLNTETRCCCDLNLSGPVFSGMKNEADVGHW